MVPAEVRWYNSTWKGFEVKSAYFGFFLKNKSLEKNIVFLDLILRISEVTFIQSNAVIID